MRNELQYNIKPEKYWSKIWNIPQKQVKDFVDLFSLNKRIWHYNNFKYWFKLTYRFNLTTKKYRNFVRYYKVYKRREELKIPFYVRITKDFVKLALQSERIYVKPPG